MPKGKEEIRRVRLSLRPSRRFSTQVKTEILCCRNPDSPVGTDRKKTMNLEANKCLVFRVEDSSWLQLLFLLKKEGAVAEEKRF